MLSLLCNIRLVKEEPTKDMSLLAILEQKWIFPLRSQNHGTVETGRDLCFLKIVTNTFPEIRGRVIFSELGQRL